MKQMQASFPVCNKKARAQPSGSVERMLHIWPHLCPPESALEVQ